MDLKSENFKGEGVGKREQLSGSLRGGFAPSFFNLFPLSTLGEGDTGGEVDIHIFDIQI